MRKIWIFAAVLLLSLVLCGCEQPQPHEHVPVVDDPVQPSCTTPGKTMGKHCFTCGQVLQAQQEIPAWGHMPVTDLPVEASCQQEGKTEGSHCKLCNTVLTEQKAVAKLEHMWQAATCTAPESCSLCSQTRGEALAHSLVTDPAVPASCQQPGKTEGSHCAACDAVLVAQVDIPQLAHDERIRPADLVDNITEEVYCGLCETVIVKALPLSRYNSAYGYTFLGTLKKAAQRQALYMRLEAMDAWFHMDGELKVSQVGRDYHIGEMDIEDLGLTIEEVLQVTRVFERDHPLYYWIENYNYTFYNHNNVVTVLRPNCKKEYIDGRMRMELNRKVYQCIQEMEIQSDSAYEKAKHYHDTILSNIYYAYESDGYTPEDAAWAHNVQGYVEYGAGVCECYAELFNMIMNFSGVPCMYVDGDANGSHGWNLAQMDDGNWYWFDLTWNDRYDGFGYDYFCVNDTQIIQNGQNFLDTHTPNTPQSDIGWYLFLLPERSDVIFPKP